MRTATVICVGTATIAAFIGAGGYGERIVTGLALNDSQLMLAGALPAALLALACEGLFEVVEADIATPAWRRRRIERRSTAMTTTFDAIVIGSGQAGPPLAARLAGAGMKTALIEREHFGGTCVNDGCIPTKTLVASARAAHMARRAADYGVRIGGPVQVDMKAVKARKDARRRRIRWTTWRSG